MHPDTRRPEKVKLSSERGKTAASNFPGPLRLNADEILPLASLRRSFPQHPKVCRAEMKSDECHEMGYGSYNMQPPQECVWNKAKNILNAGLCGQQSAPANLLYFLPAIYFPYVCTHVFLSSASTPPSFACESPACCTSDWHRVITV